MSDTVSDGLQQVAACKGESTMASASITPMILFVAVLVFVVAFPAVDAAMSAQCGKVRNVLACPASPTRPHWLHDQLTGGVAATALAC